MKKQLYSWPILLLLCLTPACFAVDEPLSFKDAEQEQRFYTLIEELRCLVCQNQSLADSNAELAQDLRNEVHSMFVAGKSEEEITDYLVARYGDFVLYRPPLKPTTLLLWSGPLLFLIVGLLLAWKLLYRKKAPQPVDEARLKYAEQLLDETPEKKS